MHALSTIFGSKQQALSSIKTLSNTVSQMGIENISFISMRAFKWYDEFRVDGRITLTKGTTKVEQEFEAKDLVDLFNQIVSFCRNM